MQHGPLSNSGRCVIARFFLLLYFENSESPGGLGTPLALSGSNWRSTNVTRHKLEHVYIRRGTPDIEFFFWAGVQ